MIVNEKEYVKWYGLAKTAVGDSELIPERSETEIVKNISHDNWLNISPAKDKEEAANSVNPNIFLSIYEDGNGVIGIVYNNVASMDKIKNILKISSD